MGILDVATVAVRRFPDKSVSTPYGTWSLPVVMVAIAGAETGGSWRGDAAGDPLSIYPDGGASEQPHSCGGYTSFGCWQINLPSHYALVAQLSGVPATDPCGQASWLYGYDNCARAALSVYESQGLGAWATWGNRYTSYAPGYGPWHEYLTQAAAAVREVTGGGTSGGSGGGATGGAGVSPPPKFALSIERITSPIAPYSVPSVIVKVVNVGQVSARDTVTAVTRAPLGSVLFDWSLAETPTLAPGQAYLVTIAQDTYPSPLYAGESLEVVVTDNHGDTAKTYYLVAPPQPPSESPPSSSPVPAPLPGASPLAVVIVGAMALFATFAGVTLYRDYHGLPPLWETFHLR